MGLCTLTDVRAYLQKPDTDTAQDTLLTSLIADASAAIRDYTRREWVQTTETRTFPVYTDRGRHISFDHGELATATTVTINAGDTAATVLTAGTDYSLEPAGATRQGTYLGLTLASTVDVSSTPAAAFGYARLQIAGTWGVATVPEPVKRACVIAVTRWFRRDPAATMNLAATDDFPPEAPESLPAASRALLTPYKRGGVA